MKRTGRTLILGIGITQERTLVACARSVDGLDGRRQAHRDVFTASSGTSNVSPDSHEIALALCSGWTGHAGPP
jgi:hypothetical protein